MNKLPNAVKWLIVLAVLGAMGALMWKVNDRASRVENWTAPDTPQVMMSFGRTVRPLRPIWHLASSHPASTIGRVQAS